MSAGNVMYTENELLGEAPVVIEADSMHKTNGDGIVELDSIAGKDLLQATGKGLPLETDDFSDSNEEPTEKNQDDTAAAVEVGAVKFVDGKTPESNDGFAVEKARKYDDEEDVDLDEEEVHLNEEEASDLDEEESYLDEEETDLDDEDVVVVEHNLEALDRDIDGVDGDIGLNEVLEEGVAAVGRKTLDAKQIVEVESDDEDEILIVRDDYRENKKMQKEASKMSSQQQEEIRKEVQVQLMNQLQVHLAPLCSNIVNLQTKCNAYEYLLASMPENAYTNQVLRPMLLRNPLTTQLTPQALEDIIETGKQKMAMDPLRSQGKSSEIDGPSSSASLDPQPARSILEHIIEFNQIMDAASTNASTCGSSSSEPSTSAAGQCLEKEELPKKSTAEDGDEEPEVKKCRSDQ